MLQEHNTGEYQVANMNETLIRGAWDKDYTDIMNVAIEYVCISINNLLQSSISQNQIK